MKNTAKGISACLLSALLLCSCGGSVTDKEATDNGTAEGVIYTGLRDFGNYSMDWYMVDAMENGLFSVIDDNFSLGIIDEKGNEVLPCEYITIKTAHDGVVVIRGENGWGYYNLNSRKFILPPSYDEVLDFSEGIGCYYADGFCHYIDIEGKELFTDRKIVSGESFSDGLAMVSTDDSIGYMNKQGEIAIHCDFDYFDSFSDGLARVMSGDDFGYMDKEGNPLFAVAADRIYNFSEGVAQFVVDGKIGYVDKQGNIVLETEYDALSRKMTDEYFRFISGVAPIMKDGLYGFMDKEGNAVVEPVYSMVMYPCEGIIRVRGENKLYGFVGVDGTVISECIFEDATEFSGGTAKVTRDGLCYFINAEGEAVSEEKFLNATTFSGNYAMVYKQGAKAWSVVEKTAK